MLEQIPQELRELNQWVAAGPNKKPLNPRTGQDAKVNDPSTWGSFQEAVQAGFGAVGFVLSEDDPYTAIDLDDPWSKKKEDGTAKYTKEQCEEISARHQKILDAIDSYTERSFSGKGWHIFVRGKLPAGTRRDEIEIYPSARHMICTGNVVKQMPIEPYQAILDILYKEMGASEKVTLEQIDSKIPDKEIVDVAMNASNGDKFNELCSGLNWETEYESQSEADLALLSIFAYYTMDNEQVRRLFRMSALGKREKAVKNDTYINYALEKIRAKQPIPVDLDKFKLPDVQVPEIKAPTPPAPKIPVPTIPEPPAGSNYPSGLVGEIAEYIYSSATRPVAEIALGAAIGLVAGIVGRSYNISGTGLNQYMILLARTGTGKEGAATGIDLLISSVRANIPSASQFMGPGAFASGQALIRVLDDKPCFLSVLGEFGLTLQQLCSVKASGPQVMLRKVLLDLYSKSGWSKSLYSSAYADTEKNTKTIHAPNVSILGESTPETFYDGLDQGHITEGLIPRFTIIEYNGNRPPRNPDAFHPPSDGLIQRFSDLITVALSTTNNNTCAPVQTDKASMELLDAFDKEADAAINGAVGSEVELQLWNRAHLKALKLSALLAVGVNPHQPIVTIDLAQWAIQFIRKDITNILARFSDGEVGSGDHRYEEDVRKAVETYLSMPVEKKQGYKVPIKTLTHQVIPYCYLRRRLRSLASFKKDRRGTVVAIKACLEDMVQAGVITQLSPQQAKEEFHTNSPVYVKGESW